MVYVYVDILERREWLFIWHQSLIDSFPTNLNKKKSKRSITPLFFKLMKYDSSWTVCAAETKQ